MLDLAPNNPYALTVATPILAAAGALGYGVEYARQLDFAGSAAHGLGALVTRTTTLQPRRARPLPQLIETPAGVLYRGIEHNPGLRVVVERFAPSWASWSLPVVVSIGGANQSEIAQLASALEGVEGVAGLELPLAALKAFQPEAAARIVAAVRKATRLPLLVKLPVLPVEQLVALAQAVASAGADALALVDGIPALAPGPDGQLVAGQLGGPALRPIALALVAALCPTVTLPVIALGGVANAAAAEALFAVGVQAVALGTALLADPRAGALLVQRANVKGVL